MTEAVLKTLKERYPYAEQFFDTFLPLEELCHVLAKEFPAPHLPTPLAQEEAIAGKALYPTDKEHMVYYLDDALLNAVSPICQKAMECFSGHGKYFAELEAFLKDNPKACRHLISLVLAQKTHRIGPWAKKHDMQKDSAALVGTFLARTAAVRVALHSGFAQKLEAFESGEADSPWDKNYCPVCGHSPNAGYLWHKEGHRYLHCSLCQSTWRYSRTTCPTCEDAKPEHRVIMNLEGSAVQRAEGCTECKHYMLVSDVREMSDKIPMYALLYCLMPMDVLMQDEGYIAPAQE